MPIYMELINFDEAFGQLPEPPIIANELPKKTDEDREYIKDLISTRYNNDIISVVPKCRCGKTVGGRLLGSVAPCCGTRVERDNTDIEPILWIRTLPGAASLVNPHFYLMVRDAIKVGSYDIIRWLMDTSYNPPIRVPKVLETIKALPNIKRGYNYFIENMKSILTSIMALPYYRNKKDLARATLDNIQFMLEHSIDSILTDYIPIPNKVLVVLEKTNKGNYFNYGMSDLTDVVWMTVDTENAVNVRQYIVENRCARILDKLASYTDSFYKNFLIGKPGIFRKHIGGTRGHFTFRAVIIGITDVHDARQVRLPWGIALTVFRPHVINKLMRRGYSLNDSIGMIYSNIRRYNEELHEIIKELISESPYDLGIPLIMNRNPGLLPGSIQLFYFHEVETNPEIQAIGLSALVVRPLNADYDGDEMNAKLSIDTYTAEAWKTLSIKYSVLDTIEPGHVSNDIWIPKPVVANINSWMQAYEDYSDEERHEKMRNIPFVSEV